MIIIIKNEIKPILVIQIKDFIKKKEIFLMRQFPKLKLNSLYQKTINLKKKNIK